MNFADWLGSTADLQRETYGVVPSTLEGAEFSEYVRSNVLALFAEAGEVLRELRWKPWSAKVGRDDRRDAAVEELVDVLHFTANLLVALRVNSAELEQRYVAKQGVNKRRQQEGY